MTSIRVVHVPGRTQYARKLRDARMHILNDTVANGLDVPRDVTLTWLLEHRPWDWLDVVHLHHLDFEPVSRLMTTLEECRRAGKRAVFTVHDLTPIFTDPVTHDRKLRMIAEYGIPFVCLTSAVEAAVRRRFGARTAQIPHGYVTAPGTSASLCRADLAPPGSCSTAHCDATATWRWYCTAGASLATCGTPACICCCVLPPAPASPRRPTRGGQFESTRSIPDLPWTCCHSRATRT